MLGVYKNNISYKCPAFKIVNGNKVPIYSFKYNSFRTSQNNGMFDLDVESNSNHARTEDTDEYSYDYTNSFFSDGYHSNDSLYDNMNFEMDTPRGYAACQNSAFRDCSINSPLDVGFLIKGKNKKVNTLSHSSFPGGFIPLTCMPERMFCMNFINRYRGFHASAEDKKAPHHVEYLTRGVAVMKREDIDGWGSYENIHRDKSPENSQYYNIGFNYDFSSYVLDRSFGDNGFLIDIMDNPYGSGNGIDSSVTNPFPLSDIEDIRSGKTKVYYDHFIIDTKTRFAKNDIKPEDFPFTYIVTAFAPITRENKFRGRGHDYSKQWIIADGDNYFDKNFKNDKYFSFYRFVPRFANNSLSSSVFDISKTEIKDSSPAFRIFIQTQNYNRKFVCLNYNSVSSDFKANKLDTNVSLSSVNVYSNDGDIIKLPYMKIDCTNKKIKEIKSRISFRYNGVVPAALIFKNYNYNVDAFIEPGAPCSSEDDIVELINGKSTSSTKLLAPRVNQAAVYKWKASQSATDEKLDKIEISVEGKTFEKKLGRIQFYQGVTSTNSDEAYDKLSSYESVFANPTVRDFFRDISIDQLNVSTHVNTETTNPENFDSMAPLVGSYYKYINNTSYLGHWTRTMPNMVLDSNNDAFISISLYPKHKNYANILCNSALCNYSAKHIRRNDGTVPTWGRTEGDPFELYRHFESPALYLHVLARLLGLNDNELYDYELNKAFRTSSGVVNKIYLSKKFSEIIAAGFVIKVKLVDKDVLNRIIDPKSKEPLGTYLKNWKNAYENSANFCCNADFNLSKNNSSNAKFFNAKYIYYEYPIMVIEMGSIVDYDFVAAKIEQEIGTTAINLNVLEIVKDYD